MHNNYTIEIFTKGGFKFHLIWKCAFGNEVDAINAFIKEVVSRYDTITVHTDTDRAAVIHSDAVIGVSTKP